MLLFLEKSTYKIVITYKVPLFSLFGRTFCRTKKLVYPTRDTRQRPVFEFVETIMGYALDDDEDLKRAVSYSINFVNNGTFHNSDNTPVFDYKR